MTDTDIAYIAGFFDGEGCVTITRNSPRGEKRFPTYSLKAQTVQTELSVLQWMQQKFGGSIVVTVKHDGYRTAYRHCLSGDRAAVFIRTILPYLRIKRPQAELGLQFQDRIHDTDMRKHGGRWSLTPDSIASLVLTERHAMYERMREMKAEVGAAA